jgi:hypothetical protein
MSAGGGWLLIMVILRVSRSGLTMSDWRPPPLLWRWSRRTSLESWSPLPLADAMKQLRPVPTTGAQVMDTLFDLPPEGLDES